MTFQYAVAGDSARSFDGALVGDSECLTNDHYITC